ncbi:MAG: sigma-70 family RNA polymerase sigma factor [Ruminococcus sp.]|nr:sigma-70 family RNA polymerase sigma factor [Ruminococcus sp.]
MSEKNYYIYINGSKVAVSKELCDYDLRSERKITYAEVDRKTERFKVDKENLKAEFIPSLEDSLDRLSEIGEQFAEKDSDFSSHADMRVDLRRALERLSHNERELIYKLFLCQTEREVADELGIYHNAVHKKKLAIWAKLHKYLKN